MPFFTARPHAAVRPAVHAASWPATGRQLLDPLVAAHRTTTGATDLAGLDALIRYVRQQGLLSNFRIYPMKSAQNAGSGSTVYGIGGLTSANFTLYNAPTWGPSGVAFDGSTQYAQTTITELASATQLTTWQRRTPTNASAVDGTVRAFWAIGKTVFAGAGAGVQELTNSGTVVGETWLLGANEDSLNIYRQGTDALTWSALEDFTTAVEQTGSGTTVEKDTTGITLNIFSATHSASTDTRPVTMGASGLYTLAAAQDNGDIIIVHCAMTLTAQAVCTASLTTAQRQQITTLINAL